MSKWREHDQNHVTLRRIVRACPRGRDAGVRYLREFVEDIKATGLVAGAIEHNGIRGLTVAPQTTSQP